MVLIAPSILSADFLHLQKEIESIEKSGADLIHMDVMDGHFVPNLTMGPPIIRAIKKIASIPIDTHLMITNAENYIDEYAMAGSDQITVHAESCTHLERAIKAIKQKGKKAGVALNPSTSEDCLKYIIQDLDLVLVMSVNPGFSGQKFLPSAIKKISAIKQLINENNSQSIIAVDGGVTDQTIVACKDAGASMFVAGNFIFKNSNYLDAISALKNA